MKKRIKITFHPKMSSDIVMFIMTTLQKEFDVKRVRISKDYDYYFAQELIYSSHKSMLKFLDCKKDAIKIMICKEDIYPDLNLVDYAIMLHKHHLQVDDRILYLPFSDIHKTEGLKENNDIKKFYDSFYGIFDQGIEKAARRPEGTWPDILYPHFLKTVCETDGIRHIIFKYFAKIKNYIRNRIFHV